MDIDPGVYIQIGQLTANVSIILWLLKYYIKQINETVNEVNKLIDKLNRDRLKINVIGEYLSRHDKEFSILWDSVRNGNTNTVNYLNRSK